MLIFGRYLGDNGRNDYDFTVGEVVALDITGAEISEAHSGDGKKEFRAITRLSYASVEILKTNGEYMSQDEVDSLMKAMKSGKQINLEERDLGFWGSYDSALRSRMRLTMTSARSARIHE